MENILLSLSLLVLVFILMVRSTGWLMDGLRRVVRSTSASTYGLAAFLLALATSLPELVVSVSAGLQGASALALGNVIGSNIANLSLVLGGAALIAYGLRASDHFVKTEISYVFLVGSLPLLLILDGSLTRWDGFILLGIYGLYVIHALKRKQIQETAEILAYDPLWRRILVTLHKPRVERSIWQVIGAGVLLVITANLIVRLSLTLARQLEVSELVIGLFVIGLGTSLPELLTEVTAVRRREVSMAFGNILGSIVANSTLILGLAIVISPVTQIAVWGYGLAVTAFVMIYGLFWYFVWTKHRLDRWEGGMLVLAYVIFIWLELWRAT